ncbi:aromatic ring-hydroxylating dioxygenase subunit alpha [Paenibacillus sp. EPM92]|uniref:aromatic ring-hydroxylating dioxygenase subunit alpha n=1 Tax=Paenibacillus sp. EPM92 TaxID=1561195 RepID=UPI001915EB7C|nr:aromatic ring-hydroxylating dioxygenase subunit alpha [Paenibacillus sp. EPM92]
MVNEEEAGAKDVQFRDGTSLNDLLNFNEGLISSRLLTDPEIHRLELDKIFAKVWVPIAHESEIPKKGDYVTRSMGEDPVVVVRDELGEVGVFLNACMHRGMHLCRADSGNSSHFRCPYHGYTYKNNGTLIGVPAAKEAYGDSLDKSKFSLLTAKVEIYNGLIFASWNDNPPALDDWLGSMKWYLDLFFNRTQEGMEVVGSPLKWIIKSNWKLAADNFIGDAYHTLMTHRSAVELGMAPPDPKFAYYGVHVTADNGHGLGLIGAPPNIPLPPYLNLPQEIVAQIEEKLTPEQQEALRRCNFVHGNIFPNLSFLNVMLATEEGQPPVSFMTMRAWNPKGPDEMEVLSWLLVEKEAPEWFKEKSRQSYVRTFGSSGTFEQDDTEIWAGITRATKGVIARRNLNLNYVMGLDKQPEQGDWKGPGTVYQGDYTEANQLGFWRQWAQVISS